MKNRILLVAACAVFALSSCKKDYDCTCTTSVAGLDDVSVTTTINDTKKNAEEACEAGSSSLAGVTVTCTLN